MSKNLKTLLLLQNSQLFLKTINCFLKVDKFLTRSSICLALICESDQNTLIEQSLILLSRHTVVCRVAQETLGKRQTSVCFTGVNKMPFSYTCSSTLPQQKHTYFSVPIPSASNSKDMLNLPNHSHVMRLQSSSYFLRISLLLLLLFATLFEIAITHTCFNGLT